MRSEQQKKKQNKSTNSMHSRKVIFICSTDRSDLVWGEIGAIISSSSFRNHCSSAPNKPTATATRPTENKVSRILCLLIDFFFLSFSASFLFITFCKLCNWQPFNWCCCCGCYTVGMLVYVCYVISLPKWTEAGAALCYVPHLLCPSLLSLFR